VLEVDPPVADAEREALVVALRRVGVGLERRSPSHDSAWRQAAAREAVDPEPGERYAPSPRSTRGATRA
jgi:hypothetical protein